MPSGTERGERALTPVVGIVLLVAITLLLAATVAAFAFGLNDQTSPENVPTAALGMEYEPATSGDDVLAIVHKSGDTLDADSLAIVVQGATCSGGSDPNDRYPGTDWLSNSLSSGESIRLGDPPPDLCPSSDLDLSSATARAVWNPPASTSTELRVWHGPA